MFIFHVERNLRVIRETSLQSVLNQGYNLKFQISIYKYSTFLYLYWYILR